MSDPTALQVSALNRRFVGFIARRPVVALVIGLVAVLALLPGLGKLRADFTHTGFFHSDDPKLKAFEAFERRFGNDDAVSLVVHSPSGIFDTDSITLLQQLTAALWLAPDVIRVDSLTNFNWVHGQDDDIVIEPLIPATFTPALLAERKIIALTHETLPRFLVNTEGTVAVVGGRMRPGLDGTSDIARISHFLNDLVARSGRTDHKIYIVGGPPLTYAFQEAAQSDVQTLIPMAICIAAFFLIVLLRSFAGTVLPLLVVFLSTGASFGLAGHFGMVQTAMSTAVPTILIAVGIADTVHLLITFLGALRSGVERKTAARYALTKNLLATFLTSLTTAIGFFSFSMANLKPLATMGIMAGFGTMFTWFLSQFVLGSLLFLLPIKVKAQPPEKRATTVRRAGAFVDYLAGRQLTIIVITVLLSGASLYYALGIEVSADPLKYFRKDIPARIASDFVERTLGTSRAFEMTIDSGAEDGIKDPVFMSKVDALSQWIEARPGMTRAISIVDILKSMHKALNGNDHAFFKLPETREAIAQELLLYTLGLPQGMDVNDRITVRNDAIRVTVFNTISKSNDTIKAVKEVIERAQSLGLKAHVTGKYFLYQDTNEYVVNSFLTSLWSANLVIGVIMMLFLRSFALGLISMIPNIVPLFAGGVLLRVIGQPLDIGTVIVASICLGISIDDTSHVLANFAYLRRQGIAPLPALKEVLSHSGPALLSTNGILICAFASFAMASFMPNFYFGILTAFILSLALITDMFFTPALLLPFGKRNGRKP